MNRHEIAFIHDLLRWLNCRPALKPRERFTLRIGGLCVSFTGDFTMQLPDDKTCTANVAFTDAKGKPARVDGAPVWASDNEAVASVVAAADGLSATITPNDLGTAQISVTADADLGAGVVTLTGLGTVEVVAGTAVTASINFGEPQ